MPIKPFDNQRSSKDSLIMAHPFILGINGQVASGKTTVMLDLMLDAKKLKKTFHRVILISPTLELDEKMELLMGCEDLCISNQPLMDAIEDEMETLDEEPIERTVLPPFHGIEEEDQYEYYSPKIIEDLIAHQKQVIKSYSKALSDRILILVEDAPALGIFRAGHANLFAKFCCTLRHYNCSVIFLSQLWKCCPKIIRHQCTSGVFFQCNEKEQEDIYETFSINMGRTRWLEYFDILTSKPFSHITFNLKNSRGKKMVRNFEEFIA